jgi:hypothetical protein
MGRTVLVAVDEAVARTVRDRLRSDATDWIHEVDETGAPGHVCQLLFAIERQIDSHDGPQDLDGVEFGVCRGGALLDETTRDPADAFVRALRHYRDERERHGDAAEPTQIVVWPTDEAMDALAAEPVEVADLADLADLADGACSECGTGLPGDPENDVCPSCSENEPDAGVRA